MNRYIIMKNKTNLKFIVIIKILFNKISNTNIYLFLFFLYKIKFHINLIAKFILLFMFVLTNSNDLASILDFGDFALKIVENTETPETPETPEDVKNIKKLSDMDMGEFLDFLKKHDPKTYWMLVGAFVFTTVFCAWLMHFLLTYGIPPKEPPKD